MNIRIRNELGDRKLQKRLFMTNLLPNYILTLEHDVPITLSTMYSCLVIVIFNGSLSFRWIKMNT